MPTYEYACSACGHHFEKFHSITARPVSLCPQCGQRKVKRLISAGAGFIFKGGGFYTTDYRSDAYKTDAKNDSAPVKADVKTGASKPAAPAKTNGQPGSTAKPSPAKSDAPPAPAQPKSPSKPDSRPAANSPRK